MAFKAFALEYFIKFKICGSTCILGAGHKLLGIISQLPSPPPSQFFLGLHCEMGLGTQDNHPFFNDSLTTFSKVRRLNIKTVILK